MNNRQFKVGDMVQWNSDPKDIGIVIKIDDSLKDKKYKIATVLWVSDNLPSEHRFSSPYSADFTPVIKRISE